MKGRASFGGAGTAVWRPGAEHVARSRLAAAMKRWGIASLAELHRASVDRPEWFWPAAAEDLSIPLHGKRRAEYFGPQICAVQLELYARNSNVIRRGRRHRCNSRHA